MNSSEKLWCGLVLICLFNLFSIIKTSVKSSLWSHYFYLCISQCLSLAIFLFSPCASSISSININIKHKKLLISVQQKSSSRKVPKTPQHMWWRPVIFRLLAGNFTKTPHNYQRILFFQFFKEILSRDQNTPCTTVCNHASNLYTWLQLSTQLFLSLR